MKKTWGILSVFLFAAAAFCILAFPSPAQAIEIVPDLTWQRSTEADVALVHESTIGAKLDEALELPLDPIQTVFDDGIFTPQINKDAVGEGISWSSWSQYSSPAPDRCGPVFELRHLQASLR